MTEKDLNEKEEFEATEDTELSENLEVTENQEMAEDLEVSKESGADELSDASQEPEEASDGDQEKVSENLEDSEEAEEASEFFIQWQKRHEAFLAEQNQAKKLPEDQAEKKEASSSQKSIFKRRKPHPKMDKLSFEDGQQSGAEKVSQAKIPLPRTAIWRSVPVYTVAVLLLLFSIYFISPLGKMKDIRIKGNQHIETASIIKKSLIEDRDYVLTTLINKSAHERNIVHSNVWIKDANIAFQFPNRFTITIEEYSQIGFLKQDDGYYSVLSSGNIAELPTPEAQLPQTYTRINLTDRELVKKLALQLVTVDAKIRTAIQDVQLTPSKVTNDLLTLTMADGNKVLVPLSEIEVKLPYYEKIAPQLQVASTVDMEVGIFSYASE